MAKCRSCGAAIVWAKTEAREGKPSRNIPLDADPDDENRPLTVEGGNLVVVQHHAGQSPTVRYVSKERGRHVTHFSTCPFAGATPPPMTPEQLPFEASAGRRKGGAMTPQDPSMVFCYDQDQPEAAADRATPKATRS
jgi:hypothetical protein